MWKNLELGWKGIVQTGLQGFRTWKQWKEGGTPLRALTVKYFPDIKSVTQRRGRIGRQAVVWPRVTAVGIPLLTLLPRRISSKGRALQTVRA